MTEVAKEDAPPVADVWPIRVTLRKPILDKLAEEIKEIEFREPTAADIMASGVPVRMNVVSNDVIEYVLDGPRMSAVMARLSKIPLPFLEKMDAVDWMTCATRLQRFFLPDWDRVLS